MKWKRKTKNRKKGRKEEINRKELTLGKRKVEKKDRGRLEI